MPTVSDLVGEATRGAAFDADPADMLAWLDRRHKEMVNFARAYRDLIAIGTTTAGTGEYTVAAGFVELKEITIGGVTYVRSKHTDVSAIDNGFLWLSGPGGLAIESTNASNQTTVIIRPVPTTSGQAITGYGAVQPPTLLIDNTVPILVDDDLIDGLLAGVYATGLMQPKEARPDLAGSQLQLLTQAKQDFERRVRRRLRGSGPTRIRVAGLDA